MQLKIEAKRLRELLAPMKGLADKSRPILEHVLVQAEPKLMQPNVTLTATDLRTSRTAILQAEVSSGGAACVQTAKLLEILRTCEGGTLEWVKEESGWITLRAGRAKWSIPTLPSEEFPSVRQPSRELTGIPAAALREMLAQTAFAASSETSRPSITGVYLHAETDRLLSVATDGYRMAIASRAIEGAEKLFPTGALVPKAAVKQVEEMCGGDAVRLGLDDGFLFVEQGPVSLSVRLQDDGFPDYRRVLPQEPREPAALVSAQALYHAVQRAGITSDEETRGVILQQAGGELTIRGEDAKRGAAEDAVELGENVGGTIPRVLLNTGLLRSALHSLGERKVWISATGAMAAVCFWPEEGPQEQLQVVMPLGEPKGGKA